MESSPKPFRLKLQDEILDRGPEEGRSEKHACGHKANTAENDQPCCNIHVGHFQRNVFDGKIKGGNARFQGWGRGAEETLCTETPFKSH